MNSILVVDDEAQMRELLVDLLKSGGFEAPRSTDGRAWNTRWRRAAIRS